MPLHPVLAAMAEDARAAGAPDMSAGTPADVRTWLMDMRTQLGEGPQVGLVRPVTIPTRNGKIPARLYNPVPDPIGLIVYLHGGGWIAGALDDFDTLARQLVDRSDCALLMVDYRLAPEAPFPAGLEDCEDAVRWAHQETTALVGRGLPLVVAGESAGGNLAAVVCNTLRGDVPIALQVLIYPVTGSDFETDSYRANADGPILTADAMRWFFGHYAPQDRWGDERVSPIAADLAGVPATFIATAEYDVLRNDGERYAERLTRHGVDVELRQMDGLAHGFTIMASIIDTASDALDTIADAIRRRLIGAPARPGVTVDAPPVSG